MRVSFSVQADRDLSDIVSYIEGDLNNPIASRNIVNKILSLADQLSNLPYIGAKLELVDTRLQPYRYLITGNYLMVYKVTEKEVQVVRLLYARSDYIKLLRG